MLSGRLRERIVLQSPSRQNVEGELTDIFVSIATVPAYVLSQRGNEAFAAARTNSTSVIRILIRYRTDIKEDWRLQWNGRFYNVTEIDISLRHKGELWITAENFKGDA